jgi:enoyl-CoA hydratase/carnithine racemase
MVTRNLAESLCAKSPLAVSTGKQMFYRQLEMGLEEAYHYASEIMACGMNSEDAREGIDAFIAKRKPRWRGR